MMAIYRTIIIEQSKKQKELTHHFREYSIWTTKCISIDIPFRKNQKVLTASIEFKPEIFNNGLRPSDGLDFFRDDTFMFIPHYPKQIMKSVLQGKRTWPVQTENEHGFYYTRFDISAVEITQHRNKFYEPCYEGLLDHDKLIIRWVS